MKVWNGSDEDERGDGADTYTPTDAMFQASFPRHQEMEVGMLTADAAARFVPVSSAFFVLDWPPTPAEFSTARRGRAL